MARARGFSPGPVGIFGLGYQAGRGLSEMIRDYLDIPLALKNGDVDEIQKRIDRLTAKARNKEQFSDEDMDFLKELYGWIAFGGRWKWLAEGDLDARDDALWEAGKLLEHYLEGEGKTLRIDSEVYERSTIVRYAVGEIKKAIASDVGNTGRIRNGGKVSSRDVLRPKNFGDPDAKGQVLADGVLLAEQANKRLHYANNRFILDSTTMLPAGSSQMLITVWRVEDEYVFASFEEQKKKGRHDVTVIPVTGGRQLRLPDGLSHYLTTLGLAKEFSHYAEWREQWSLPASR